MTQLAVRWLAVYWLDSPVLVTYPKAVRVGFLGCIGEGADRTSGH
jgi:hypothetical protein